MIRPAKIPLLFLFVTFTLLAGHGESRLNSGFPMSEPTEGTEGKATVQEGVRVIFHFIVKAVVV